MTYAGKQAIVTGAGSGIGTALCRALVAAGAEVVCTDVDADAAVTADDHPADTDTLVRRVVAVHQSLIAPDSTVIGELPPIALYMTATRANRLAGWAVSGVTVR